MITEALDRPTLPASVATSLAAVPQPSYVPVVLCRCGHEKDAHEHYRSGDDCGVCGAVRCRSFRKRTGRGARSSFQR